MTIDYTRDYQANLESLIEGIVKESLETLQAVSRGTLTLEPQQRWACEISIKSLLAKVLPDKKTLDDTQITPQLILNLIQQSIQGNTQQALQDTPKALQDTSENTRETGESQTDRPLE